jgi:transcriptional regulator with XRE-family HTH domain
MLSEEFSETFQGLLLRHRGRSGLTQRELASRIGVHPRSIQDWEAGVNHPRPGRLSQLIDAFLSVGALTTGHELEEAESLWNAAQREADRMWTPFDRERVTRLLFTAAARPGVASQEKKTATSRHDDWGDAPHIERFIGRASELASLEQWLTRGQCRVALLYGMGGIGKSTVAARFAEDVATSFERIYWRNLVSAPSFLDWVCGAIDFIAGGQQPAPQSEGAALLHLTELLREHRCLLVLDNFDTVLEPNQSEIAYRVTHACFGRLIRVLAEAVHQSCVIITSREIPDDLTLVAGPGVRTLELVGLSISEGQELLRDRQLVGDAQAWTCLVSRLAGNALALKIVGEAIRHLFAGDIAGFVDTVGDVTRFGGLGKLLNSHIERLSGLEHSVVTQLALDQEPLNLAQLATHMDSHVRRAEMIDTVQTLIRRSLILPGERPGTFALPSILLEHARYGLDQPITSSPHHALAA